MHLHKQKLTKYFRGHYIIMVGVTNFKELGVTFSCSVFAAFFWELPKNFPHVWFLLNNIKQIIPNKQVGLYRDDGLAVVQGNNSQLKRIEKKLHQLFKSFNLKIEVTFGMKSTDFLDIILDLSTDSYRPHMKDNNKPVYIHSKSNHPPNIKRQLPVNIAKRISDLSSNELIFHREKLPYQQALHEAGYNVNLDYTPPPPPPPTTTQRRRTRSRKTIYFNPPYCQNVKTNVGKKFLSLIDKHFANTPLEKYINRSTIKISYSTMPNIASIISSHNKKILNTEQNQEEGAENRTCNCRYKNTCPQAENCLQESAIYKAEVTHTQGRAAYIGLTGGQFKTRYNLHTRSFRNRDHKNDTTLSQYIWKQTDKGIKFKWHPDPKTNVAEINWSYLATAPTYSTTTNTCILCNREKAEILYSDDPDLLNKRDEITSKCRHRKKFLLSSHLPEGWRHRETPPHLLHHPPLHQKQPLFLINSNKVNMATLNLYLTHFSAHNYPPPLIQAKMPPVFPSVITLPLCYHVYYISSDLNTWMRCMSTEN